MNEPSETVMQGTWTYEALVAEGLDPQDYEIVAGELVEEPPMSMEGCLNLTELSSRLHLHVKQHDLGVVLSSTMRYMIQDSPRTERKPDLSFIRKERLGTRPYPFPGVPDLAVEVLSPSDSVKEAADKAREYLEAGGLEVWNVDPAAQVIIVFRPGVPAKPYGCTDALETELLPGFALPLGELFRFESRRTS